MQIYKKANLKPFHTFSIDVSCEVLVIIESKEELISVYKDPQWSSLPKLMLGKGSNLLFTQHYNGVVIVNRIKGITVSEDSNNWLLHVNGGEDWPKLVEWSVKQGMAGLENLALIPGCAGSAPIQNIGAYGKEFKDVCQYVDVLHLDDLSEQRLSADECLFAYRDSIFKQSLYNRVVIMAVGIKLDKEWQPLVNYGSLADIPAQHLTPQRVFDEVCQVRMSKLPDPAVMGNAGSFFKNPVVSVSQYQTLLQQFPDLVAFPFAGEMKLAAGWLIDKSGLKGQQVGGAQVHQKQALVLINHDKASAEDIVALAEHVRQVVYDKFSVSLEHEVRFMDGQQETSLLALIERTD